ncbi:MAG: hypothetical protein HYY76_08240 [Acidobacteria bacterium]|nr:hypothetical protein [Acidobacteriota bacterium]
MLLARGLAAAAVLAGIAAWLSFLRGGLVLSHYDARAHLVVARRIIDNITPGWPQIGAVWLPLPHLLHAVPAQVDAWYRTGFFGSLVSVACFGVTTYALTRMVLVVTGSRLGAAVTAALLILNPNLLYLHATPMTEPLLLATTSLALLWLYEWVPLNETRVPVRLGVALLAAVWTRYEGWLIVAAALVAAVYAAARIGASRAALLQRALRLGVWPAAAVLLFVGISRATTGSWLVSGGFYERDPYYDGQLVRSVLAVWWGTHQLSTRTTEVVAMAAAALVAVRALAARPDAPLLVPVTLFAAAALPAYAFYAGHPFRVRYMVPLVAACALFGGVAVGVMRRHAAMVTAGLLVGITLLQSPPWRQDAPVIVEARSDEPLRRGRRHVTACLAAEYGGEKILASMGSLAHYMQELSHAGFEISDFVHEGNGAIWELTMETGPALHTGWMLVEEQAEGGDVLARRIRQAPEFLRGMTRVCEGGGVALYRRDNVFSFSWPS